MDLTYLPFLMARVLPSTALMYFIVWLAIWGKSYRSKVRLAWLAHLIGLLFSTLLTAVVIFLIVILLGGSTYNPDSPVTLFLLPGVVSILAIRVVFGHFLKKYPK